MAFDGLVVTSCGLMFWLQASPPKVPKPASAINVVLMLLWHLLRLQFIIIHVLDSMWFITQRLSLAFLGLQLHARARDAHKVVEGRKIIE